MSMGGDLLDYGRKIIVG